MSKISNILHTLCFWVCSILLFSMTFLIFGQVIARYIFSNSLTWSEELGRYFYVWISLIGIAIAIPLGAHVSLDLLVSKLPPKIRKGVGIFSNLLIIVFTLIFTYSGYVLTSTSTSQISSGINISMTYVYMVFPISGLIMFFFALRRLLILFREEG